MSEEFLSDAYAIAAYIKNAKKQTPRTLATSKPSARKGAM